VLLGLGLVAVTATSGPLAPQIAAHRGGSGLWPENSLSAFRGALGLGVDLIELDVHLSRDGEVMVIHDATLDRTTTDHGPVAARTAAELAPVALRGGSAEGVPRLAAVLELLRSTAVGLLLEIKVDATGARYAGIEAKVLDLLAASRMMDRTTVMAFEWATLERLRALSPTVRLAGLLARRDAERMGGVAVAGRRLVGLHVDDLGIERTLLAPEAVAAAHQAGLTIGVWTVNDPGELARALAAGVEYVTTDRPDLALQLRASRP
jgi:glycerophosphoryl diester phosphodiesterase